jgi:hypothetical protein
LKTLYTSLSTLSVIGSLLVILGYKFLPVPQGGQHDTANKIIGNIGIHDFFFSIGILVGSMIGTAEVSTFSSFLIIASWKIRIHFAQLKRFGINSLESVRLFNLSF